MSEVQVINYHEQSADHEGKKTPVKSYDWDEIENIDVTESFDLNTIEQARRAHSLTHWAWDDRALPGWHYDEIIAEHARAAGFLIDRGERHVLVDSLDTTLPEDLKEKSSRPENDISYIRTVNYYLKNQLELEGIDSVKKLKDASTEELAEDTGLDPDYLNYIQEKAEEI